MLQKYSTRPSVIDEDQEALVCDLTIGQQECLLQLAPPMPHRIRLQKLQHQPREPHLW